MSNWFREPISHQPIFVNSDYEVDWRGTIGVGDSLYGLNCAYALSHLHDKPIRMNFHWKHEESYNYHFEDPETIVERTDYFHNFYHERDRVSITHTFNSRDTELQELRWRGFGHKDNPQKVLTFHHWIFRPEMFDDATPNKVVFWRPTFNREIPSGGKKWKMTFSVKEWERIIQFLELKGYDMVELTYRTPASEAMYHIRTCSFCIFYDGMWQYIARNLCKPVISLGGNNIVKDHSPQGVFFKKPNDPENDFWDYLYNLPRNETHLQSRANRYRENLWKKLGL